MISDKFKTMLIKAQYNACDINTCKIKRNTKQRRMRLAIDH